MSERFTASNGLQVYIDETGMVDWDHPSSTAISEEITQAFREFFAAERDRELGRVRVEGYPDYAVYPIDDAVWVLNEGNAMVRAFSRESAAISNNTQAEVARAWFAAQEPPKPWEQAVEDSAWVITVPKGTFAAIFQNGRFRDSGGAWATEHITDAKLLWSPEAGDES